MRSFIVFVAAIFGVFLFSATIKTYWLNYRQSDGVALPNREIVGGDFLCFYVAGENAAKSPEYLYDFGKAHLRQQQIIGGRNVRSGYLPFAYPPLLALLFSTISWLPF
jgi:hypothetical protein